MPRWSCRWLEPCWRGWYPGSHPRIADRRDRLHVRRPGAGGGLGRGWRGEDDARTALVFAGLTAAACWAVLRWPWLALGLAVVVFAEFRSLRPRAIRTPTIRLSAALCHIPPEATAARGAGRRLWSDSHAKDQRSHANRRPRAKDALFPEPWAEYMPGLVGRKTTIPTRDADSPFLDAAGVRYLLLLHGVRPSRPGFQPVYRSPRGRTPGRLANSTPIRGVDPPIDRRRVRRGRCAARRAGCQVVRPADRLCR